MLFDGSTSLLENHCVLYSSIEHAIWLSQFTPVYHDHLIFVHYFLWVFVAPLLVYIPLILREC
jgi:hypothetical protein